MNITALFAGIGGIEKGLVSAGHRPLLLCENDEAALAVLKRHFRGVPIHRDVAQLERLPRSTELVTAGFPCQDLSPAGIATGITGRKSGLITEVFRLIRKCDIPHLLLENVPFMLQLNRGAALRFIVKELERQGYRWAYRVINSMSFGLPQRRERVFLLASKAIDPSGILFVGDVLPTPMTYESGKACGFYWTEGNRGLGWAVDALPTLKGGSGVGIPSPPAIWMPDGSIVTPDIRDAERLQGFPEDWTKPAARAVSQRSRWRLVGNAVTVNVAKWLGQRLNQSDGTAQFESYPLKRDESLPKAAYGAPGQYPRGATLSSWPVRRSHKSLVVFLKHDPQPLSRKALIGFTSRLQASSLNYPPEFLAALEAAIKQHEQT